MKYTLKKKIMDNSLTQEKLARICGVTLLTMSKWCNIQKTSKRSIPSDKLKIIAELFDCTMEDLYTKKTEALAI